MERPVFLARCYEVCNQAGKKLPELVMEKAFAFAWEVMNYGHNPKATEETVSEAVADMYISLMAIAYAFDLKSETVGKIIERQLGG